MLKWFPFIVSSWNPEQLELCTYSRMSATWNFKFYNSFQIIILWMLCRKCSQIQRLFSVRPLHLDNREKFWTKLAWRSILQLSQWLSFGTYFFLAQQPPLVQGLLIHEVSRSYTLTTTVGRTPLHEGGARRRGLYLTTQNTHSSSQRPLPYNTKHSQQTNIHTPVGFEPTISANEWPQTYTLDRAVTGSGHAHISILKLIVTWCGPGSSVTIATEYGLDGPGSNLD